MQRTVARRRSPTGAERRSLLYGLVFVAPWIVGFLLWTIYPLAASIYYSLTRYDLVRPAVFIGLANYNEIANIDPTTKVVVYNTLYWVMLSAPLGVLSAFLMAALLNTRLVARSVWRGIFFFPSIVPSFVTAVIWLFLLNTNYGAINATLRGLGLPVIPFLSSPPLAKPSLVLIHVWAQGGAMVIFLASLQEVPRSLHEAATVDGASSWHRLRFVTIPMCSPVILFNLVMGFIGGFQEFTVPWILTQGGPNQATEFYSMHLYRNAFAYFRMGKACALAWILFVMIVAFTFALFRSSGRWVYYAGSK